MYVQLTAYLHVIRFKPRWVKRVLSALWLALAASAVKAEPPPERLVLPSLYSDPAPFKAALAAPSDPAGELSCVTGAIVPHHLLAIDVLAEVFRAIAKNHYRTIFVLSPDHFFASQAPAATTRASFQTPFGLVHTDPRLIAALVDGRLIAEAPRLFEREHGIHAVLPFIAKLFPGAHVVPIALSIGMRDAEVDAFVERLKPLLGRDSLVLLSSDFSHYLPPEQAMRRDQETLNLLAAGDNKALRSLIQPDHVDSRAGLLVQQAVQAELGSQLLVIQNRNSQQYSDARVARTTSYLGAVYASDLDGPCNGGRRDADLCFGGDFFTGRGVQALIENQRSCEALVSALKEDVGNCPLVVNLEGVLVPQPVAGSPSLRLWAHAAPAIELLNRLGVVGVSLANNHSGDFGDSTYYAMRERLRGAGIAVIEHGALVEVAGARIFGMTEVAKQGGQPVAAIAETDFDALRANQIRPPTVAFLHWGRQFETEPDESQLALAAKLRRLGITGIVGAHPHRASPGLVALNGGGALLAYSLGNLLFDQTADVANGAILKLYLFEQGTFFARQVAVNNLFDLATGVFDASKPNQSQDPPLMLPPLRHRLFPSDSNVRMSWMFENGFP